MNRLQMTVRGFAEASLSKSHTYEGFEEFSNTFLFTELIKNVSCCHAGISEICTGHLGKTNCLFNSQGGFVV